MKDIIVGLAVGAVIGYLARTAQDKNMLDQLNDNVNDLTGKAKNKIKDIVDKGKNKAEYLKDRTEHELNKINKY